MRAIPDRIEGLKVCAVLTVLAGRVDPPRAWETNGFSFSTWNVQFRGILPIFADRNNHNNHNNHK